MAQFCVETFMEAPSREVLERCRKADLLQIAVNLALDIPNPVLKKDLKLLIVEHLEDMGILKTENESGAKTEPEGSPADPDECDDPEVPAAAEAHEGETMETGKAPLTVRKSVPTSPGSPTEGSRDARLQVRLARLDMEREERAQAKRLQMELEVRRMEIEADTAVRIRKLELEAQLSNPGLHITPTKAPQPATTPAFDITFLLARDEERGVSLLSALPCLSDDRKAEPAHSSCPVTAHSCTTRFPEAIPLNSITTRSIIRALTHFFSIFGLPKVIQTDQGTNFKSKLFKQVTKTLGITHVMSSAYHPQSQGALERWHQTLKAMLTKYCLSKSKTWEEGLPFVLFAAREAVQDSLGFSPAQLVFGHTPRGPLKALKERFLFSDLPDRKVREYVQLFQKRLKEANSIAKTHLDKAKLKMKVQYDKTATRRNFAVGDKVLVLTPLSNSALSTKFEGPFEILSKLGDTNYVLHTPARRQKSRVCHVNMLKRYEDGSPLSKPVTTCVLVPDAANKPMVPQEAGEVGEDFPSSCSPRLNNSEALKELEGQITHLSPEMAGDLVKLIHSRKSLFVDVPTQTTVLAHHVEVSEAKPIRQHPYRASPEKRLIMKEETEYLLKNGFAIPSRSPWSSPCLVERKPDGTARFITDYRKLNAVTISDSYPLPRIDDCVDSVGPSKFVTKLDLLKGYWQVPLTEEASLMSAFVTPDAFLQYTVLPFGMKNAPATFQRLINTVTSGLSHCSAYLDDIVVYTDTWEEHLNTLTQLFDRLVQANLTLNLAKCDFVKATVTYLGKEVGQGKVKVLHEKVKAMMSFPPPSTRRELRRFLGMVGYYRGFCRNFSAVVLPLTDQLSPKRKFEWTSECQASFEAAKLLLCSAPVLAAPDLTRPFKLEVDASAIAAGSVLIQEDSAGIDHPVCYFSKKFNRHQLHYSTIEKETLALLLSLQHFHVYVGSSCSPTIVYTDHNPLTFLSRMYNQNQRLMRWALILQEYAIEVRHKKGTNNIIADGLSRSFGNL
ncbi:uncharacterized protein [Nothobranchius furzeri]|uniref:uncharacterized protein n=1 Tax=Nothobranchius furzeri TaxID=105023 RepID=UPI00390470F6